MSTNSVNARLVDAAGANRAAIDILGNLSVMEQADSVTGNGPSSVASSASDVLLLAANLARRGCAITNDSTAILYVSLGTATASATAYTAKLVASAYYEVPFGYTGQLRGIWASANGFARITEVVS